MGGEQGGAIVDVVPAEDAGRTEPRVVAYRLQAGEAAPIARRFLVALSEPEDAAGKFRQGAREAERIYDVPLEARGAVAICARRDPRAPRRPQRPNPRPVGKILFP